MEQSETVRAAVEPHLPLVGGIARAMSRRLPPTVEMDELINDGVVGLIEALGRYDPGRRVGFSTYAGHRIRGAILDGLRTRDPLTRACRRAQKAAGDDGIHLLTLDEAVTVPGDDAAGPEALALEADLHRQVRLGLAALPPRDRQVLVLRMVRGLPLRAVAARLSLSITRVAEIQARGLTRMRRFLSDGTMERPRRGSGTRPVPGGTGIGPVRSTRQEEDGPAAKRATAYAPVFPPAPLAAVGAD